jgi:UDP-N-acetylmuramoyl-L-alanyl-D-glutamate--2,6-diaminopimelate ligase
VQLSKLIENVEIIDISGDLSGNVSSVCYDSKKCDSKSVFIAIEGLKADGHRYIDEAISRGAKFIVHEKDYLPPSGITAIRVKNSRRTLGIFGKNFYGDPSSRLCFIGVLGTNGKTTVTYLLESILQAAGFAVGVLGTINYRFHEKITPAPNTTPESFEMQKILREMLDEGITHVVAEISSHAVDLKRVDDCAFDLGIFTNLSQDHLDYHRTMEKYFQAKKRFFDEVLPGKGENRTYTMIVNADDPWGQRIISEGKLKALTYCLENKGDIKAEPFKISLDGIEATIRTKHGHFDIFSPMIGKFNLYNILAAAGAAAALNIPQRLIQVGIENLKSVPGRLERVNNPGEPQVFVDYAHTDDALWRVLQNLSFFKKRKIITIFGCGGDRDRGKRPLMGKAATTWSDLTIVTSDNPRSEDPAEIIKEIEAGIDTKTVKKISPEELKQNGKEKVYVVFPDRKEAINKAIAVADVFDIVLVAGKGHEDYQIIGDKRIGFDDRLIARDALTTRYRRKSSCE